MIAPKMTLLRIASGEYVVKEGERGQDLFFLLTGVVDCEYETDDGETLTFVHSLNVPQACTQVCLRRRQHDTSSRAQEQYFKGLRSVEHHVISLHCLPIACSTLSTRFCATSLATVSTIRFPLSMGNCREKGTGL